MSSEFIFPINQSNDWAPSVRKERKSWFLLQGIVRLDRWSGQYYPANNRIIRKIMSQDMWTWASPLTSLCLCFPSAPHSLCSRHSSFLLFQCTDLFLASMSLNVQFPLEQFTFHITDPFFSLKSPPQRNLPTHLCREGHFILLHPHLLPIIYLDFFFSKSSSRSVIIIFRLLLYCLSPCSMYTFNRGKICIT